MRTYDFRSDSVTLPTRAMMDAVATAPLGDSARGDDPTVARLEEIGRELTGKEDALFVPSGTMGNLGVLLFTLLLGGLVKTVGYDPFFVALGVLDLLGAVVLWTLVRERRDTAEVAVQR